MEQARHGKRNLEWDLNNWKWDGDLFIASQLNPTSSSCSDEPDIQRGDSDRKRRVIVVVDDDEDNDVDEGGTLSLKLGQSQLDATIVKRDKVVGSLNRPACQVEGCCADLSNSKDYHRRHKVCEVHSKTTKAIVGNVIQRFCQQCSRLVFFCLSFFLLECLIQCE